MNLFTILLHAFKSPARSASKPSARKAKGHAVRNRCHPAPAHAAAPQSKPGKAGGRIAYHGTPDMANARSIQCHGWMVGSGNAHGDGIYLAQNLATAKSYASGPAGVYLKCHVSGRVCQWTAAMQAHYAAWCQKRGVRPDNSAKTAFLLKLGYEILQAGNVLVVLVPQMANPTAWKRKDRRIRVLGIYRAADDRRMG